MVSGALLVAPVGPDVVYSHHLNALRAGIRRHELMGSGAVAFERILQVLLVII